VAVWGLLGALIGTAAAFYRSLGRGIGLEDLCERLLPMGKERFPGRRWRRCW
jgi:hypothetical protein